MKSFFLALLAASAIAAVAAPTASADGYYYGRGGCGARSSGRVTFSGYYGGCARPAFGYGYAPRTTYYPAYAAYPAYSTCGTYAAVAVAPPCEPAPVYATACAPVVTYPTYYTAPCYAPSYAYYAPSCGYRSYGYGGYYSRPSFSLGLSFGFGFGGHRRHCR